MAGNVDLMADKARSILDRLKAKARNKDKSFQLLLQLFCQEEFLRRVQHCKYNKNLVLKGGLYLYSLSNFEGRPTMDIDFELQQYLNSITDIEHMIKDIISVETGNNYVKFNIVRITPIAEQRKYNGVRIKMIGNIKNTRTPFNIDLGVGDIIVPKPEKKNVPTQLNDFEEPEVLCYSLESTVAEKFDAVISRMELSSRMKDYYDLFYLAHSYKFDAGTLKDAIIQTLKNRGTYYEKDTLEKILRFKNDGAMQLKWGSFIKNISEHDKKISLSEVLQVVYIFLSPIFTAILQGKELHCFWNPATLQYENG